MLKSEERLFFIKLVEMGKNILAKAMHLSHRYMFEHWNMWVPTELHFLHSLQLENDVVKQNFPEGQ